MTEHDVLSTLTKTLNELTKQVAALVDQQNSVDQQNKAVYTNKEMMGLLDASSATLKKWRDLGYLSYSVVGSSYYYSQQDVDDFLKNNHYEAYRFS